MKTAAPPLVAAVDLRKLLVNQTGPVTIRGRTLTPSEVLTGSEVVKQAEAVTRRILLKIDSKGGDLGSVMPRRRSQFTHHRASAQETTHG